MTRIYSLPKGKGVHRSGTAAELADQSFGYSVSGESQFTREASRGTGSPKMVHRETRGRRGYGKPLTELIRETAGALAYMQAQLRVEDSAAQRAKLTKNIAIKTKYLAKLNEQAAAS